MGRGQNRASDRLAGCDPAARAWLCPADDGPVATTTNRPAEPTLFTPQRLMEKLFIDLNSAETIASAIAVATGMQRKLWA